MVAALDRLLGDLSFDELRIRRPNRFTFLCGGRLEDSASKSAPICLRDYLVRIRGVEKKLGHPIVLAENAQQIYRDTSYPDLITFEEDIAKIAAVVLVISESAGALAELGAFSSTPDILNALRVLISEENHEQESFVRFGPIKRVEEIDRERIGVFPWRVNKSGQIIQASVKADYVEIVNFLKGHVESTPETSYRNMMDGARVFYDIMWITYLADAITPGLLYELVRKLNPGETDEALRNKIFCMKVAGWMATISYGGRDYYCNLTPKDPFVYAFRDEIPAAQRDALRRRIEVRKELRKVEAIHPTIIQRLDAKRAGK